MAISFSVSGKLAQPKAPSATPLPWVTREGLELNDTRFRCAAGLSSALLVRTVL